MAQLQFFKSKKDTLILGYLKFTNDKIELLGILLTQSTDRTIREMYYFHPLYFIAISPEEAMELIDESVLNDLNEILSI